MTLRIGNVPPLGWFWKLGSRLDNLPVAVTACINLGCSKPLSFVKFCNPSTKVFKYVEIALCLSIASINSLNSPSASPAILFNVSLSVLNPESDTSYTLLGL